MTREEEDLLIAKAQQGDKSARAVIVAMNRPVIYGIADKYSSYWFPIEDLMQEGAIGVLRALEDYDASRSRFLTYARQWVLARISGRVLAGLSGDGARRAFFHADAAEGRVISRGGGSTDEAIAAELSVTTNDLARARSARPQPIEVWELDDVIDPRASAEDLLMQAESTRELARARRSLSPRSSEIIRRRFLTDEPETLAEIGRSMGISREYVRQIEAQSLADLRHEFSA